MKIKQINASGFGKFNNEDSLNIDISSNSNLVIFYGKNESGKSTIFNLIITLFYGWNPASRETNPYVPWNMDRASCGGTIIDEGGREIFISRRLLSRVESIITFDDKSISIGNKPIDILGNISEGIFKEVYALTLDKLQFPEEYVWEKIQDQVLGGQFTSLFRPLKDVVSDIEMDANSLWRPDRRGSPKAKLLNADLSILNKKLIEARDNEDRLYALERELDVNNKNLADKLQKKADILAYINKIERLLPIKRKIDSINELEKRQGNISEFDQIPENVLEVLKNLRLNILDLNNRRKNFAIEKESLLNEISIYTAHDKKIIENELEINSILKSYGQISADIESCNDMESEIKSLENQINDRARDFIVGGYRREIETGIKSIDEATLRDGIKYYKKWDQKYQEDVMRYKALNIKQSNKRGIIPTLLMSLLLIISGVLGKIYTISITNKANAVYWVLIVLGISMPIVTWILSKTDSSSLECKELKRDINKAKGNIDEVLDRLSTSLKGVPISDDRIKSPDESLLVDINRIRDLIITKDACITKINTINARIGDREKKVLELINLCGINSTNNLINDLDMLEVSLNLAKERQKNASIAMQKLDNINDLAYKIDTEIEKAVSLEKDINNKIEGLEGDNIEDKVNNLLDRRKIKNRADALKEEIGKGSIQYKEAVEEIRDAEEKGEAWTFSDEEIARAKTMRDQIDIELNEINKHIGSLKKEIEHLQEKDRLDDIRGEIEGIQIELNDIKMKRDRIMLIRNIILEADRQFREEHQPDVLKKASSYLYSITDGKYDRLFMDDEYKNTLYIKESNSNYPIDMNKALSKGTKEQVYLSLRLALIDHLDEDKEKLPIFLDEALVNWDGFRLNNLYKILGEIKEKRQVFIFTCHKYIVDEICNIPKLNPQIINL